MPRIKRPLIIEKHERIRARFTQLYQADRLRLDDVYNILRKEFFVEVGYIQRVLSGEYDVLECNDHKDDLKLFD